MVKNIEQMKSFEISNYGTKWDVIAIIKAYSPIEALRYFYQELDRTRNLNSPYLQLFIYEANEM